MGGTGGGGFGGKGGWTGGVGDRLAEGRDEYMIENVVDGGVEADIGGGGAKARVLQRRGD